MEKKHLSPIANDVLRRCAQQLDTSEDALVQEFEAQWSPEINGSYARKLVEFCCSKALANICSGIKEKINDGSYSQFTFNMMLAWEMPSSADEESYTECVAKEKEDRKVDAEKPSVGEDSFVWLATLVPFAADVVNGRFTFETLTAPTGNRLHFPAYDKFLKEIDKWITHLQNQAPPKGVELADDEFILHVEGTATSQRVVRHIGGTSWPEFPGRLTLTNYALYFETFGIISYEDAIKLDLLRDDVSVKPAATGPWGAPLFDKAIVYESPELQEGVVLEFPELTSSTRRDHWLALAKEVMLLHRFLRKFKVESPVQKWETHARTILGITRLHAAREMLRISPPVPKSFLIFVLYDEVPKGDYVLAELAENLKNVNSGTPCSASSILRNLIVGQSCVLGIETEVSQNGESVTSQAEKLSSLDNTISQVREEAKEIEKAQAPAERLKEEWLGDSILVLMVSAAVESFSFHYIFHL
ncbi:unnamed protein product [Ilex paraguariensis]|uniref:Uncharacterized protein n=1 Tax=Ilex paraguariensis TaxID=185542 RepID=A0ABC8RLP3_9AQUA